MGHHSRLRRPTSGNPALPKTPIAIAIAAAIAPIASSGVTMAGLPAGADLLVSRTNDATDFGSAVAMDADGDFVVVWNTFGQGIFARRYGASGLAKGEPVRVNQPDATTNASLTTVPAVAMDADGDFVVAWTNYKYYGYYAENNGLLVAARRYDRDGAPLGNEFTVHTMGPGINPSPSHAKVAMDADGDFVVTWRDAGVISARAFAADGAPRASEFQVNQAAGVSTSAVAAIGMDADGDFVVAWTTSGQDGSGLGVSARVFDATGAARTGEFQVNESTADNQSEPSVAMDADGDFVIAWTGFFGQDCPYGYSYPYYCGQPEYSVYLRRYSASGAPLVGEVDLIPDRPKLASHPAIAASANGDFAVAWRANGIVLTQFHDAAGSPKSEPLPANTCLASVFGTALAMDADGDHVVAWDSQQLEFGAPCVGPSTPPEVLARRFAGGQGVDLSVDLSADAGPVAASGVLTYTISVDNQHGLPAVSGDPAIDAYLGAVGVATGVVVTFAPPAGATAVAASGEGWVCTSSASITCRYGSGLLPLETRELQVTAMAPRDGGTAQAAITLTADQFDGDATNNAANVSTAITPPPPRNTGGGLSPLGIAGLMLAWLRCRRRVQPA